jgi:hypothetical protein
MNYRQSAHCNENIVYVFLFWELRDLSANFHIHVSLGDFYFPKISPNISCSRIGRPILEIYKSLSDIVFCVMEGDRDNEEDGDGDGDEDREGRCKDGEAEIAERWR